MASSQNSAIDHRRRLEAVNRRCPDRIVTSQKSTSRQNGLYTETGTYYIYGQMNVATMDMFPALTIRAFSAVLVLASIGIFGSDVCSFAQTPPREDGGAGEEAGPMEVTVYPNSIQRRLDSLSGYLEGPEANPQTDVLLTLDASNELYNNGELHTARELLRRSLSRIEKSGGAPVAKASLLHAISEIEHSEGKYRGRLKNLIRAEESLAETLGEDHEITALARLKTTKAFAETELSAPNSNYLQQALRRSREIRDDVAGRYGEDHPVAIKAELSAIAIKIGMRLFGDVDGDIASFIKAHADNNDAVMAALVLKTRMYRHQGNSRALEDTLKEIAARSEGLEEPVMAVDIVDHEMRSGYDKAKQEFFSIDGRALSGGPVISTMSPDQLSSEIAGNFVDVSFCVDGGGQVRNMDVLGSSGSQSWVDQAVEAIGRKRYVVGRSADASETREQDGAGDEQDSACHWKYERYKVMSEKIEITGTRIRRHSPLTYMVREDLLANNNLTPDYLRLVTGEEPAKDGR